MGALRPRSKQPRCCLAKHQPGKQYPHDGKLEDSLRKESCAPVHSPVEPQSPPSALTTRRSDRNAGWQVLVTPRWPSTRLRNNPQQPGGPGQPGPVRTSTVHSLLFQRNPTQTLQNKHPFVHPPAFAADWRPLPCRHEQAQPRPLCDIPSGCCFFTGPWTVTRSSLVASGCCFLSAAVAGAPAGVVATFAEPSGWCAGAAGVLSAFAEPSGWCAGAVLDVAWCAVCASAAPSSWRIEVVLVVAGVV